MSAWTGPGNEDGYINHKGGRTSNSVNGKIQIMFIYSNSDVKLHVSVQVCFNNVYLFLHIYSGVLKFKVLSTI